ncbi:hypothetical protein GCM10012280_11940 [Wenjunlia tyrosinilytica]|uniref:Uncharacterized protein n=1 Tax=Wenjunlia tyrosinilytica TaxID=1544741 RepID=A0A918DUS1_9ACTN|nr:hypothetical protein GCM10012280_11940 [Wenjunlia tyrosinilytica]
MDCIRRVLEWVKAVLGRRSPGRHRCCPATRTAPATPMTLPLALRAPVAGRPPRVVGSPLDGDAHAMVRPYLLEHERREEQRRRRCRRTLLVAATLDMAAVR